MRPWNLVLRFLLELASVAGIAVVGWQVHPVVGVLAPVAVFGLWGTFAVPDDPSRGGSPPVVVTGLVRLAVELAVFGGGTLAWWLAGRPMVAAVLAALLVVHHLAALPRLRWLLTQR